MSHAHQHGNPKKENRGDGQETKATQGNHHQSKRGRGSHQVPPTLAGWLKTLLKQKRGHRSEEGVSTSRPANYAGCLLSSVAKSFASAPLARSLLLLEELRFAAPLLLLAGRHG